MSHAPHRLAVLVLALLWAAGCAPAPTAPTAISWMVRGDPAETKAFQDVADAFEAQHPGVTVTLITIATGEDDYFARLGSDLVAGTPADVVYLGYLDAARYYANGAFQPLTAQLAASDLIAAEDFYAPALEAYVWAGEQMCMPINLSSLVTYYNQDLFDAAGLPYPADDWTWDDLLATAQALTQDTNGDGVVDQYGLGTSAELVRVLPFIWQNGGDFWDPATGALLLDTPAAQEAVQFFVDLQARHHVTPDRVAETAQGSQERFENGTLGLFWQSRRVTVAFRTITAFDWDVAPLPTPAGGRPATILHSDGLCVPTAAAHPALAWQLIEFASSVEGMRLMAATGRTVPPNRAVAESEYFLAPNAKPARSHVWLDAVPGLRPGPVLRDWEAIGGRARAELERAYYGDISAAEALQALSAFAAPRLLEQVE